MGSLFILSPFSGRKAAKEKASLGGEEELEEGGKEGEDGGKEDFWEW